jgi:LysM repeat protein
MESPWISQQQQHHGPPAERPWVGMALIIAVPLLTLVLIRMLWSGSSLWFLTVGLILLGIAAVIFLARRPQEQEYSASALAQESNRVPLVLAGVGLLFLAMLLLPNFAGGSDNPRTPIQEAANQDNTTTDTSSGGLTTDLGDTQGSVQTQPTAQPVAQQPGAGDTVVDDTTTEDTTTGDTAVIDDTTVVDDTTTDVVVPEGSQTYVVEEGDTLWDIATTFGTSVDAIILANGLDNPSDIQIDQELAIPPPDEDAAVDDTADGATE